MFFILVFVSFLLLSVCGVWPSGLRGRHAATYCEPSVVGSNPIGDNTLYDTQTVALSLGILCVRLIYVCKVKSQNIYCTHILHTRILTQTRKLSSKSVINCTFAHTSVHFDI